MSANIQKIADILDIKDKITNWRIVSDRFTTIIILEKKGEKL